MSGWLKVPLRQLIEAGRGISYGIVQPGPFVSDGVPIIRVGDIRDGLINTAEPLRVKADIEANYSRTRLNGGELLVTVVGNVGQTAIVPSALRGWNVARAVAVLPIQADVGPYWVKMAIDVTPVSSSTCI